MDRIEIFFFYLSSLFYERTIKKHKTKSIRIKINWNCASYFIFFERKLKKKNSMRNVKRKDGKLLNEKPKSKKYEKKMNKKQMSEKLITYNGTTLTSTIQQHNFHWYYLRSKQTFSFLSFNFLINWTKKKMLLNFVESISGLPQSTRIGTEYMIFFIFSLLVLRWRIGERMRIQHASIEQSNDLFRNSFGLFLCSFSSLYSNLKAFFSE